MQQAISLIEQTDRAAVLLSPVRTQIRFPVSPHHPPPWQPGGEARPFLLAGYPALSNGTPEDTHESPENTHQPPEHTHLSEE